MNSKVKVLITGATGFIGYHLIEAALEKGWEVYAGIRLGSDAHHLLNKNIQLVTLNYFDLSALKKHFLNAKYTYVIHAAGATKAPDLISYNQVNAEGTANICEALQECPPAKFVFVSSLAAIGPVSYGAENVIDEQTIAQPITSYGKSKLLAESYVRKFNPLPWVIIRPTAVYGPREKDFFVLFQTLNRGLEAYIGSRRQMLSMVYVTDLVDAITEICTSKTLHKTYNISDGSVYSQYELSGFIKKSLNRKAIKILVPLGLVKTVAAIMEKFSRNKSPLLNKEKIEELIAENWQCSISAAQRDFNFQPKVLLQEGIQKTTDWYKQHRWL